MSGLGFHTQKMCRQSKMEQLENLTIRQLGNGQEKKTKQHSNPCESAEEKGKSVHRGWGENQNQLQQSAKHLYFWSDILFAEIMHSCLSRDYTHIIQPWKQKDRETPIGKICYLCYRRKKNVLCTKGFTIHVFISYKICHNLPASDKHDARHRLGHGYNSTSPLMLLTPLFFLQLLSTSPLVLQSLSP